MDSIETDRLLLRPFTLEDIETLHSVIGDDADLTWNRIPQSVEGTENTLRRHLKHYDQHDFGVWAVVFTDTGKMIGQHGLQVMKDSTRVELVAYTAKQYWRQGIAFEACTGALTYGFVELALPRIVANIRVQNIGAQRTVAKLGFHFVREDRVYGHDVYCYEILREEFEPGNTVYTVYRDIQEVPMYGPFRPEPLRP